MLNQIKALLQDAQLRQKIQEAKTQDDFIEMLTTASAQKGYNFKAEDVTKLLTYVALQTIPELNEKDLQEAARGRGTLWSASVCCPF